RLRVQFQLALLDEDGGASDLFLARAGTRQQAHRLVDRGFFQLLEALSQALRQLLRRLRFIRVESMIFDFSIKPY
ncbi:MAG TPA: hypothetical protein PKO33_06465, partial [Pyrinomonadaceae bacterium]|nr:hypothetical protein [Pyrinomonadaceae bacterium]